MRRVESSGVRVWSLAREHRVGTRESALTRHCSALRHGDISVLVSYTKYKEHSTNYHMQEIFMVLSLLLLIHKILMANPQGIRRVTQFPRNSCGTG